MKKPVPRRVILTREEKDIERDRSIFEEIGFEVVSLPLIKSEPADFVLGDLNPDWVLFQSVRAVEYFLMRADIPDGARIAVVGDKTRGYLESLGYRVDFVPSENSAEGLVREFPAGCGEKVLIPRSSKGRDTAIVGLKRKGYEVVDLIVYGVESRLHDPECVKETLSEGGFLIFASPSAVKGLFANLQKDDILRLLRGLVVVAIGKTTKKFLESEGLRADLIPRKPLMEDVAVAINSYWHDNCQINLR